MASITKSTNGRKTIQFTSIDGKRYSIRLGKTSLRQAEAVKHKVEDLLSSKLTGSTPKRETSEWLSELGDDMYDKFAAVGLVEGRCRTSLANYIDAYIEERTDVKGSTRLVYVRARQHLVQFFGSDKRLRDITPGDADLWRLALLDRGLAENTVRKSCGIAKQFFNAAIRKRLITENPFSNLVSVATANTSRMYFITEKESQRVLEACPDAEWRLLFALARYGGLRVPSEALALKWSDIDWANERFTVSSSKTEHHEGGHCRVVPMFPELKQLFMDAFVQASEGQIHCIARYRDKTCNLRTRLTKIIKQAGLSPWPKLWQNLRSTRETELANEFPIQVVTAWIGNSMAVAHKHYLQVTDEHHKKAVQNPVQRVHAGGCFERNGVQGKNSKSTLITSIPKKTAQCINTGLSLMGHTGLEPVTSSV